jgi:hypothetical protein
MRVHKKAAIFVLALAGWLSGESQFVQRSVEGVVTDNRGNPLSGAAVLLENTMDLQVRSYLTQQDGHYHFQGLSDDIDYTLKAHYFNCWSKPKTLSKFDSSLHAKVNLIVPIE